MRRARIFPSRTLRPYLQLMRPANLVTAAADILAGYAASGMGHPVRLLLLVPAAVGLYGGGVVLNDCFDAEADAIERPERPIPKGEVKQSAAFLLGGSLLLFGIGSAFLSGGKSGLLALLIALCAVIYDVWGKHRTFVGPVNMGICRGLNLLLGLSAVPSLLSSRWYLGLIPVVYISAVTVISRGEVYGGKQAAGRVALALIAGTVGALLSLSGTAGFHFFSMIPFLALFTWKVVPAFWRAYADPRPQTIRAAVQTGVLSLVLLNSTIAAGYAGLLYGMAVLALRMIAIRAARHFAVT